MQETLFNYIAEDGTELDVEQTRDGGVEVSLTGTWEGFGQTATIKVTDVEERKKLAWALLEGTGWGVFEREAVMQAADLLDEYVAGGS